MKNTLTKVLTIIAIVLVGLIAISAVTLSLIKYDFNQVIDTNKISGITVYTHTSDNYYSATNNADDFNKMKELYNKGTKESLMSAIFQGAFSKNAKAEVLKATTSTSSLHSPAEDEYVIAIDFCEEQLLEVNGEKVQDTSSSTPQDIKFKTVYLQVKNNDTLTKVKCYIVSNTNSSYSYRQVSYPTHHSELYDFVDSLDFPG